ncbi:hypothetical protein ACROYT_G030103 [Oculina patagonica]
MAFNNLSDFEAALNACSNEQEWENFTGSVQIPEHLFPLAYQRLVELSLQDITFEIPMDQPTEEIISDSAVTSGDSSVMLQDHQPINILNDSVGEYCVAEEVSCNESIIDQSLGDGDANGLCNTGVELQDSEPKSAFDELMEEYSQRDRVLRNEYKDGFFNNADQLDDVEESSNILSQPVEQPSTLQEELGTLSQGYQSPLNIQYKPEPVGNEKQRMMKTLLLSKRGVTSVRPVENCSVKKKNLNQHEEVHIEKPFKCSKCDKAFRRKTHLKRHEVQVHQRRAAQREYKCNTCGAKFNNMAPFRAHQKTAHTEPSASKKRPIKDKSEPKPKKMKQPTMKSKTPVSTNWPEDPKSFADLPEDQQRPLLEYKRHWHQIRTHYSRPNHLLDWYNYRLSSLNSSELITHLDEIFEDQSNVFKLNIAFGFILRNNETNELQYYYASRNNNLLFESPFQIATAAELQQVRQTLEDIDILEFVRQQRPSSKWVVDTVTNITFYITKIRGHPIGCGCDLPGYLRNNPGLIALDRHRRTGRPFNDNLCFFRALALHNGCHTKNLERDAHHYYQVYRQAKPDIKKFCGVTFKELSDLEQLFEVNIFVYSLEPTKLDGDDDENGEYDDDDDQSKSELSAELLYRSFRRYSSTLYLNLYQNHFSYIKDMKKYSKSYSCSRCGKYWKDGFRLNRHEKTCEAKVRFKFPGGAYKTPPTIFELLEDEGFTIPQHLKYFPYRATFDFECIFSPTTGLNDTEKLTWNAKHIPLSVSVCSNIPGYDQPKCFVSDGDPKQLVKEMVDYLVEISQESFCLVREEFSSVFDAIDQKLEEIKQLSDQPTSESNIQEGSDDEGEDLMETDVDEDEEIEAETEEDRAFLDDEVEEEQGPSFYRALDREREDEDSDEDYVEHKPEVTSTEPTKKKEHPLKKLRDRFVEYLKELPVLGFNSGKYDLNAAKEFLFPVLVQNEQVQFTIKRNHNFMCLKTTHLRFLDVTNFLAPRFSYDKFQNERLLPIRMDGFS